jgi:hypothetical protein
MESIPRFVLLAPDLRFLETSDLYPGDVLEDRARSLASAVSHSPIWDRMGPGMLVLRTDPVPTLAALGRFDEADLARLSFLARWLAPAIASTRYLDPASVEAAVGTLAGRLRSEFGNEVRDFDFAAVPRGGLIVLGMLAYALDVDGARLGPARDPARPLVIVDDCALTGSRFRRFVAGERASRWVFAHLCSPPELRSAMIDQVPQLSHAIAAIDLRDLAPVELGEQYREWRARVELQAGAERLWIGQPENVVFPWSEPDHNFWNAITREVEWGWRLAPPDRCLKAGSVSYPDGVPVQVVGVHRAGRRATERVLYARFEDRIHLLDRYDGKTFLLDEVGSCVWEELMAGGSDEDIANLVASRFDVGPERALTDVRSLTSDLLAHGVLAAA